MTEFLVSLGLSETLASYLSVMIWPALLVNFVAIYGGVISVVLRKVGGWMQSRLGPNRVGPEGSLQWLADAVKLILKEGIVPAGCDKLMWNLAPMLIVMGVFATFVVIPWGSYIVPSDLNVGILYVISITALTVVGILMAGWASNNKWSLLGGMRGAAQIVTYEIPVAMGLLPAILMAGSLQMTDLMKAQGWAPTDWLAFQTPFSMLAFLIFFVGSLAEANQTPFDFPEAESELVQGFTTEYTGFRFAAIGLGEFANTWVVGAVCAAVFLGGGNLPASLGESAFLSLLMFVAKVFLVVFVMIWLRWTLPRFRIDQAMEFSWKYLLPLSFVAFFGQALFMMLAFERPWVQQLSSHLMVLAFLGLLFKFTGRVMTNIRQQSAPVNSPVTIQPPAPEAAAPVQADAATEA